MKKAILLLLPLAFAFGCSRDGASDTRAAERGAPPSKAGSPTSTTTQPGAGTKTTSPTSDVGTTNANAKKADNTGVNVRDRDDKTLTPPDQLENETDLALTKAVRQALVGDDVLSFDAENVKIISQNGKVTLRGPVKDQHEKDLIESKAKAVAGVTSVDNQLEVKGP